MDTAELGPRLAALFSELVDGAPESYAYMLNPGDPGLLRSLDRLSAEAASTLPLDRSGSVVAHVDHVRYGLSLLNRWAEGEPDPFGDADWSRSWERTKATEEEWHELRAGLREQARRWHEALRTPREAEGSALEGMIASVAHVAYHLGAMRQIDPTLRGPREGEASDLSRG